MNTEANIYYAAGFNGSGQQLNHWTSLHCGWSSPYGVMCSIYVCFNETEMHTARDYYTLYHNMVTVPISFIAVPSGTSEPNYILLLDTKYWVVVGEPALMHHSVPSLSSCWISRGQDRWVMLYVTMVSAWSSVKYFDGVGCAVWSTSGL